MLKRTAGFGFGMGLIALWIALLAGHCLAAPVDTPEPIDWIYVHGSNLNQDGSAEVFQNNVNRLHPQLVQTVSQNRFMQTHFLKQAPINAKAIPFFWGKQSRIEVSYLQRQLNSPALYQSKITHLLRDKLSLVLHDAVWLQNQENKQPVLENLYETTQPSLQAGHSVFYLGHSAGSLILFDFMLYRLPYLVLTDFAQEFSYDPAVVAYLQAHPQKRSCLAALLNVNAVRWNHDGKLISFMANIKVADPTQTHQYRLNYIQDRLSDLAESTERHCLPDDAVKGFITFGSPLVIFEGEVSNRQKNESYLTIHMIRYLFEHQMVWLNINHVSDPLGIPLPSGEAIKKTQTAWAYELNPTGGFMWDYISPLKGPRFYNAHSWYWQDPVGFSNAIVEAYQKGYQYWYPAAKPQPH